MDNVDFGYMPDKTVLHDITLYAEPGQKVAFVGAPAPARRPSPTSSTASTTLPTARSATTASTSIRSSKADLRRSWASCCRTINLFTGTVMDNIRYGKLDATDEECIRAAKLANADRLYHPCCPTATTPCSRQRQQPVAGPAPADFHRPRRRGRSAGYDSG